MTFMAFPRCYRCINILVEIFVIQITMLLFYVLDEIIDIRILFGILDFYFLLMDRVDLTDIIF